ncbi:MAG: S8 family peptidase [Ardenticatenia bacterium]|nr:S8 family peptidase [Ardenticatenia bacterium]
MNTDGTTTLQRDPALDAVPIFIEVEYTVQIDENTSVDCTVEWRTTAIHVAWQDFRNGNADVFYGWMFSEVIFSRIIQGDNRCLQEPDFSNNKPDIQPFTPVTNFDVQTIGMAPLSEQACWGPNSTASYNQAQSWQGEPTIKVVNEFTVRVAWSDGRSYDDLNYDIHTASFSRLDPESYNYLDSVGGAVVNNNVKRLRAVFDEQNGLYRNGYADYLPAGASQRRPTMLADPFVVAWDDNRYDDPTGGGSINRDIFVAQFVGEPQGTYISPVFDAGSEVTWYDIQWWAATQTDASLVFQVRLGTTPNPPLDDVAANGWTRWSGVGGAGGIYDAPGQNIRDGNGNAFPKARYIQYRLLINQDRPASVTSYNGACVSEVTLNYQPNVRNIYLPIVSNGSADNTGTTAVPNDELYQQYQWNLRLINAETAWAQSRGDGVIVAVVDTGIDVEHPEFAGKLVPGYDFARDDAEPDDEDGHGTHVAGIVAANTDNGDGIAGVGWNARIMPLKVFDDTGLAADSDVAAAIRYAADNGARIINLSLGSTDDSQAIRDAIQYARSRNVLVVASSGNAYEEGNPTIYPAAIPEVLAVAAVDNSLQHASYSSAGPYVDVAAPGGDPTDPFDSTIEHWIWSTYPRTMAGIPKLGYNALSGTSQAAPHVAGLAALIWSKNPSLSADDVANIIVTTASDLGTPGRDDFFGYGLVNAGEAVKQASTTSPRLASSTRPFRPEDPQPLNRITAYRAGELLVALRPGVTTASLGPLFRDYGATFEAEVLPNVWLVRVPEGAELAVLSALTDHPAVRYAEPNFLRTLQ